MLKRLALVLLVVLAGSITYGCAGGAGDGLTAVTNGALQSLPAILSIIH